MIYIATIILIILLIAFALNIYPDKLSNGDWIIWYNSGGKFEKSRDYFVVYRKKH